MPRLRRKDVFDPTDVGVYHCINRCVRRAYLCGTDAASGQSFEHRKQWIQDRLELLAGQFGIDVLGFAVMSNHLHVVLRNRPDVVAGWSDEDVARRWWNLFPQRRDPDGSPADPESHELQMLTADPARLEELRRRLSSLSWFMRCLAEPIARRANREDEASGRFWEGRYKCQPLLDEAALAACLAYVDLNPIRAGIAESPESSRFTSAYERIQGMRSEQTADATSAANRATSKTANPTKPQPAEGLSRDHWLSPLELAEDTAEGTSEDTRSATASCEESPFGRASSRGCLPMSLADYLRLLDWTGRQLRRDKRGAIPADLAPILDRLRLSDDGWLKLVRDFRRLFRTAAGAPPSLHREALRRGRRWLPGIAQSRMLFG